MQRNKLNLNPLLLCTALLFATILLLTGCTINNKVVSSTKTNNQGNLSSDDNKPTQNVGIKDGQSLKTESFIDLNHGWIVNAHSIFDTEDGGLHWAKIVDINGDIYDMDFLSLTQGWLSSSEGLLKTADGGKTWININKVKGKIVTRLQFVDEKHGWIYAYNVDKNENPNYYFMRTTDGGEKWLSIEIPDPDFFGILAFSFISPTQGWAISGSQPGAGSQPKKLYKTTDGGISWDKISSTSIPPSKSDGLPMGGYVSDLCFLNEKYGWFTESRGQLFVTSNGGKNWTMVDNHPVKEWFMSKPFFVDRSEGYVLNFESGRNSLLITKDGGLNWKQVYPYRRG